jgi:hypothetical protein
MLPYDLFLLDYNGMPFGQRAYMDNGTPEPDPMTPSSLSTPVLWRIT